jgi:hypothetical protein
MGSLYQLTLNNREGINMLKITKKFLEGNLEGETYTFKTYQPFELGKIYSDCITGKKYEIVAVERITD